MRILKVLSLLLSYPDGTIAAALPEIEAEIAACTPLPEPLRRSLARLAHELATDDLITVQERYVALFDQTRSLSLHLFEHVLGESRDRGQALVDLRHFYERHEMQIAVSELPDYLPLALEFASLLDGNEALELLGGMRGILASLAERLARRRSPYAAILQSVVALAGPERAPVPLASPSEEPVSGPALDRVWEEEPVSFRDARSPAVRRGPLPPVKGC